ncbi:hypothetical protein [Nostoc punctiforme]|uniref:Uncharacterized protein n=1 Tax=Nostoc punctiforme (strain ATCC 29133 / PCC 73102) TaxID=63737 RepID=B2J3Z5_NOSP7|nr:hypothetical protein [Nostoc punctiforme]ACC80616.1 hypothetical protein Npun_R1976 [Nostoc punctiforme PCC 73102]
MTTAIVHPGIENLQQFSDSFDIEKLLQSDWVLPWLLANAWNYDDESSLIANIVDESTSIDEVWDSKEFDLVKVTNSEVGLRGIKVFKKLDEAAAQLRQYIRVVGK